jgi:hypothetical protein
MLRGEHRASSSCQDATPLPQNRKVKRKGGGMKKQMILALAIFGHLFLFLFVDSLFEAPTRWKMWAFYGSSLLSVAVWGAYVIKDDMDGGNAA